MTFVKGHQKRKQCFKGYSKRDWYDQYLFAVAQELFTRVIFEYVKYIANMEVWEICLFECFEYEYLTEPQYPPK